MTRSSRRALTLIEACGVMTCLFLSACSGDKKPAQTTPGVTGTSGASGTPSTAPSGGTGTPTATSGTGATPATAGRGVSSGASGTGSAAIAGRGVAPAAGSGSAGTPAAAAGTGALPAAGGGSVAPPAGPPGSAAVLQYHKNASRDGHYVDAAFTRAAAPMLKKDTTFNAMLGGDVYAQPLYYESADGKDLLITASETNEVKAFNAADGSVAWMKTLASPVTGGLPCGNITPLGVTGTPVIDAATQTLYVAAMTSGPKHQIFALSLADGSVKPGWPVDVSTVRSGSTAFNSSVENQRGALLIVGDRLYVPYGGHFGDCGDYHGWVVGVALANPTTPVAFATAATAGGIWAPGGLASDGTSVFAATGNTMQMGGGLLTTPSTWGHGNAILRLSKELATIAQTQNMDFFAAQDWQALDRGDLDIGGSGPVLFSVSGATPANLIMALGKGGAAYLISQANLGGLGGELQKKMVTTGGVGGGMIQAAAAYTTPTGTFVAFRSTNAIMGCPTGSGNFGVLKVTAGSPPSMDLAWCASPRSTGSPIVTSVDGMNDSIVWFVASGKVVGFNGENGMQVFSGGGMSDGTGTTAKFQTPIVAKGRLFVAANGALVAFTLK